jgi:Tetratricopeptide repeat
MNDVRRLLAVLGLLFAAGEAPAQGALFPYPCAPGGFSASLTVGRGKYFSLSVSGSYGLGYYGAVPYGYLPTTRVTTIYGYATPPPPLWLASLPLLDLGADGLLHPRVPQPDPPRREMPPPDEGLLPGKPAGGFRPVQPEDRAKAQQPIQPEPAKPDPPKPPERPPQPKPEPPQPRDIVLGRQAFAAKSYGLAAQHFRRATLAAPDDALGHFLLAQALYALGKYRQAVETIHAGLRLEPNWPAAAFRPLELYGPDVLDHAAHREDLEDALALHPGDPVLLFLYAYQLWFDGRKEEAKAWFRKAAAVAPDPGPAERFLRALPAVGVL